MSAFFYELGRKAGPKIRKAKWLWAAATESEAEAIAAENKVGADLARQIQRQRTVCVDERIGEFLATTGTNLTGRLKDKKREFTFTCLSGKRPEAFCLPGGFVFVSRPMVELCNSDPDKVAFLLAHEMAHVIKGHAMERMVGNAVIRAGVSRYTAANALKRLGSEFLTKAYSRKHEFAADAFGFRLACAAGFDGQAAITFFEKLAALEQPGGKMKYFSSHPEFGERIASLRQISSKNLK